MAKLPDNYLEILSYLRDNQRGGMTTGQILETAKKKRYFELANTTKISSTIFYMRAKRLLTSIDQPGGRVHKITGYGLSQLEDELGNAAPAPVIMPTDAIDEIIEGIQNGIDQTNAPESPQQPELTAIAPQKARDLLAEFDEHLQIVRTALIDELAEIKTQRIENKQLKLAVLEKLETMYNKEIGGVIAAIRGDIEQMN